MVKVRLKKLGKKLGIATGDSTCDFCKEVDETINHIFLHCVIAKEVWRQIRVWWGIDDQRAATVEEVLSGLEYAVRGNLVKRVIALVEIATLSSIWQARNEAVFENRKRSPKFIFEQIQLESFKWLDSRAKKWRFLEIVGFNALV